MRSVPLIIVVIVVLSLVGDTVSPNPIPDPPSYGLMTEDEFMDCLRGGSDVACYQTYWQLCHLAVQNLSIIEEATHHERQSIRRGAMDALSNIGEERAMVVLRNIVRDEKREIFDRVYAADALADARDFNSIEMLNRQVEESDDPNFRENISRAIRRINQPDYNRPIIETDNGYLVFRFFKGDVKTITITEYKNKLIGSILPEQFDDFFRLLHGGTLVASHTTIMGRFIIIVLKDGRKGELNIAGSKITYLDKSKYGMRTAFAVESEELSELVALACGGAD